MDNAARQDVVSTRHTQQLTDLLHIIAKTQDEDAVEQLYRMCRRMVFSVSYAICRDTQMAEDVLQETILYVWQHAGEHRKGSSAVSWICVIARHLTIDAVRKKKNWDPLDENLHAGEMPPPERSLDDKLSLWSGIDRLGNLEGQVFVLKAWVGMPLTHIARLLNITYRRTHYAYHNAREVLAAYLANEESGGDGHAQL